MAEYKVKFEVFEGPMDLLLYLVKKEEVDIYEVNLTKLAREFIEYVDLMREFDIEIAGEFLVMASTLMYIKSKELLPVDQQVQAEDDEGGKGGARATPSNGGLVGAHWRPTACTCINPKPRVSRRQFINASISPPELGRSRAAFSASGS